MYLSTLLPIEKNTKIQLQKSIDETWKTIYEYLGKNKDKALDDDEFLRNHWIMYFGYNSDTNYDEFLLKEKFTAKAASNKEVDLEPIIKEYISDLKKAVKEWFYLHNPQYSTYSAETKKWLEKLNRLGMRFFAPLLMATLVKKEAEEIKEEEVAELVKAVERYIFLVFHLSDYASRTGSQHFQRLTKRYYSGENSGNEGATNIEKVTGEVKLWTDGESVGWFDLKRFQDTIENLLNKQSGFYSWTGLRYFLYEYELHLQEKAKNTNKEVEAEKVDWEDMNKQEENSKSKECHSIEHIYPQTPSPEWKKLFKGKTQKQKYILLHNLGNLVLVTKSSNSEMKNKSFEEKKKAYKKGSYSQQEVALHKDWTPQSIWQRSKEMLEFMEERWKFKVSGNVTKKSILQLEFMK